MKRDAHPERYFHNLQGPEQRTPPPTPGSANRAPTERDASFPEPPFQLSLSEFPVNRLLILLNRAPVEKGAHLQSFHETSVDEPPIEFPNGAPWIMMSVPRALLPMSFQIPRKELQQREVLPFRSPPTIS